MKKSPLAVTAGAALLAVGLTALLCAPRASAAPFVPGDLVVYRVGNGTETLTNTGNSVFLDEYSPAGLLVQSIALPNTGAGALIASGTATSEGLLSLSSNGQYLALTGYNTAVGGTANVGNTASTAVARSVAIVNFTGTVTSQTNLTDLSTGNNVRSAVAMNDGQSFYATGGAGGIRYATVGATTSLQLSTTTTNLRGLNITGGQLYTSSSSGATRLATVGTGLPTTSGQTITNLPGISTTNSASPYQFAFADLSGTVLGVDTLYVAEDTTGGGVIQKFSLVGGTWTANGTIAAPSIRGLTLSVDVSGNVDLFGATGGGTATGGGSLYSYVDNTGYNIAVAAGATVNTIATAGANTAFRGIAFAPTAVPEPATVLGGLLLLGAAGWSQRRRFGRAVNPG